MNKLIFKDGESMEIKLTGYVLDGFLGDGSYSVVNKATSLSTGKTVAIKFMSTADIVEHKRENRVVNEIIVMKNLVSPHVIQLQGIVLTPSHVCIVMEYASRGDMFSYLERMGKLKEDEARPFYQQLISGVQYCHQKMIAHRDLKLENLVLDEKFNLKISDFGLSTKMEDDYMVAGSRGSPFYVAPEVWSDGTFLGPPVDVWSCGVILYTLLCGHHPFQDIVTAELYNESEGVPYEPADKNLSSEVRDLIEGMLAFDPMQRLTIPEIIQHPWFQA